MLHQNYVPGQLHKIASSLQLNIVTSQRRTAATLHFSPNYFDTTYPRQTTFFYLIRLVDATKGEKKERKSIHPLNINRFNNYYNTLNECDNIRMMLMANCMGKAPNRAANSCKLKGPHTMKCFVK